MKAYDDVSGEEGIDYCLADTWDDFNYDIIDFTNEFNYDQDDESIIVPDVSDSLKLSLDAINDLYNKNKLNEEEAQRLKSNCKLLYEAFIIQKRSEQKRLEKAKKFASMLEKQKLQLESFDEEKSDGEMMERSEATRLREKLRKCSNDLMIGECAREDLQATLIILKEETRILHCQVTEMQISNNQDGRLAVHLRSVDALNEVAASKRDELKLVKEGLDLCVKKNEGRLKEVEILRNAFDQRQEKLDSLGHKTSAIMKQSEILLLKKKTDTAILEQLDDHMKDNRSKLHDLANELLEIRNKNFRLLGVVRENETRLVREEEFSRSLKIDYECSRIKENDLIIERSQLDMKLEDAELLMKRLQDTSSKQAREFKVELRRLREVATKFDAIESCREQNAQELKRLESSKQSMSMRMNEKDFSYLLKEIDARRNNLEFQNGLRVHETEKAEQLLRSHEKYFLELMNRKKEIQVLNNIIYSKTAEKNTRVRDLFIIQHQLREARQEVKLKLCEIEEKKSELHKNNLRFKQINELYNLLRGERHKLSKLFIIGGQNVLELKDKVRLQSSEMNVLKSASIFKDGLLQKHHVTYIAATLAVEKLRCNVSVINMSSINIDETRDKMVTSIDYVNKSLVRCRQDVQKIKNFQKFEGKRKDLTLASLDNRKMEIEKHLEKNRILDGTVQKGDIALSFRDEEVKILRTRKEQLKRNVEVFREKLKTKRNVENKLTTLQIQIMQHRENLIDLENRFIDPKNEIRLRFLEGGVPSQDELNDKFKNLMKRLRRKSREVKEKTIIYKRISDCTKQAWDDIKMGKHESLALAKHGSHLRHQVTRTTLKIMASVAELSMRKAETLHLEQLLAGKRKELEEMEDNLAGWLPISRGVDEEMEIDVETLL